MTAPLAERILFRRPMTAGQKKVRVGAIAGIAALYPALAALHRVWPAPVPGAVADNAARLALAARCALWPAAFVFVLSFAIGGARARGGFTDPLVGPASRSIEVDKRVLTNSIEQGFVFLVALGALAVRAPAPSLKLVPILTLAFVIGRVAFWIGYRIEAEHRAAGMAITYNVNLITLVAAAWLG